MKNIIKNIIKEELSLILKEEYDYRVQHTAPDKHYGAPLYDLTLNGIFPKDVYKNINHYSDKQPQYDSDSIRKIFKHKNKPDDMVLVYRAVPAFVKKENAFNPGDWVTTSKRYAEDHAMDLEGPGMDGVVYSTSFPAKHLWTDGNSINEWGYDPS